MPYFYKISDMISPDGVYNMKWVSKVLFTLYEFSGGCPHGNKISVILFFYNGDLISKADNKRVYFGDRDTITGKRPYVKTKTFEYVSKDEIPRDKIGDTKPIFSISKDKIKEYYEQFYEQYIQSNIRISNIIQDFKLFKKLDDINKMFNREIYENIYIHITCQYNVKNIMDNGFLSQIELNNRVENRDIQLLGNRIDDDGNNVGNKRQRIGGKRNKSKKNKKNKKNKKSKRQKKYSLY